MVLIAEVLLDAISCNLTMPFSDSRIQLNEIVARVLELVLIALIIASVSEERKVGIDGGFLFKE